MSAIVMTPASGNHAGVWTRLKRKRAGMAGMGIVALFAILAILAELGLLGSTWGTVSGGSFESPSWAHWWGTNRLGQDVFDRAMYSTAKAFRLGVSVTVLATALGAALGALAGWRRGSWLDEAIIWMMGVLDSIPFYLFVAAVAYAMGGTELAMLTAMVATFWTATSRLVRAEVIRLREREYVLSARAIGLPGRLILWRHLLPNSLHILLVQGTLTFVAAIKTEVILSFLGLGVKDGVSWGLMLAESTQDVLSGQFANFIAASGLLFLLLLGFNLLADALQDAIDVREVMP